MEKSRLRALGTLGLEILALGLIVPCPVLLLPEVFGLAPEIMAALRSLLLLLLLALPDVTGLLAHRPAALRSLRASTSLRLSVAHQRTGSLAPSAQAHRPHLMGRARARIARLGLAGPRMQNDEEIAEIEARLGQLKKGQKKFILFQIIDDVLDYLTDMGGYTGFTEEELKMGADLDAVSSSDKFMRPKEEDAQTKATTDVFVVLLIAVPLIGLGAAAAIFGSTYFP